MDAFPLPLTADAVRALRIHPHLYGFWQEWLGRARAADVDPALCDAVDGVLAAEQLQRSRVGRAVRAVRRTLSAVGLTPSRLKRIDHALLRGRGVRALRHLRGQQRS
jgi:hypothetical protein